MVNAQEYIESNFPKHVSEICVGGNKNLEGDLDLSEYPNLVKVELGFNPQLKSLKLAPSSKITWMSIYDTGIDNFSFLANLPNIKTFCLPRTGGIIGESAANEYIAKTIRENCQAKDQEKQIFKGKTQQQITELEAEKESLENQVTEAKKKHLTESEKKIIKLIPDLVLSVNNFLTTSNNYYLNTAEEIFAEYKKNDLSIQASPNLSEGLEEWEESVPQQIASSFNSIISLCKSYAANPEERKLDKEAEIQSLKAQVQEFKKVNLQTLINKKTKELAETKADIITSNNLKLNEDNQEELTNLLELQVDYLQTNLPALEKQLEWTKKRLSKIITNEEISLLCRIQQELTELQKQEQTLVTQIVQPFSQI